MALVETAPPATVKEPPVSLDLAQKHGLLPEEYRKITEILGREPTYTELGIFSVMWSEHCSYKNSIALLKTLPREGKNLLAKAGEENAGVVDLGDGLAVVFKIESHNHPSAVEPYQGAATGVGGIMRDVFTMGARPVACLDSLRFGDPHNPKVRRLVDGVVRGIGDYGNSFGVPTVGGEIYFEDCYTGNPLVNAMAVGLIKKGRMVRAVAKGVGNPVVIVGAATGRDGIHGATFASEEISEASEARRPSVQVGDPFLEKLLLEATLEIIKEDLVVGIQDMGAAGLTCSTSEMAARGGCGMEVELAHVPLRETGMTPYEIMLSESQERMLVVVKSGSEKRVSEIFTKWGLNSAIIGKVTADGLLRVKVHGRVVAEIPANSLVLGGGAPVYVREKKKPEYIDQLQQIDFSTVPAPADFNNVLLKLLASPNIASKEWVTRQYDTSVRTNTVVKPGSDAAVLRLRKTNKALAVVTDCNARFCYLNPRRGAMIAVAEAARNVVCAGARPLAITNCLNFGNPYDPEVFWTFAEVIAGMGAACRAFETPVTGGNVSFYNEDPERAIYPTPVIGMVGLVEDVKHITTQWFKDEGDVILLLGENREELGGSEYLKTIHGTIGGEVPALDLDFEKRVQAVALESIQSGWVKSAHDCSDGGLAVALAECCITNPQKTVGAEVDLEDKIRPDALLFGETQSRIILSASSQDASRILELAKTQKVPCRVIGRVVGSRLRMDRRLDSTRKWISEDCGRLAEAFQTSLGQVLERFD